MKYGIHLKGIVAGRSVLSHSCSGSTLCHFILHLKLIVFLRPETLDYTQDDFSSPLCSTVLGDLTLGTMIQTPIGLKYCLATDNI